MIELQAIDDKTRGQQLFFHLSRCTRSGSGIFRPDWLYEMKIDGYRALAFKSSKEVRSSHATRTNFNCLTSGARRKLIQRRFNTDPAKDPLRILLATDAAREGLNFQAHCADLFHFDLPWNPGRIEQRNGRIDRKLQPAPEVNCRYFVLPQRAEDRVLEVLVKKTETIKRELGSLSKVIDDDIERLFPCARVRDFGH
jgi:hypothetical protein